VALHHSTPSGGDPLGLRGRLDTLGDHVQAQCIAQSDDRAIQRDIPIGLGTGRQTAVELDELYR
jgi:hypothetical protein